MAVKVKQALGRPSYQCAKRALDVGTSLLALCVTLPLMTCVAVAIRIRMGAPVFFRQTRAGLHERQFELVKFRTMRPNKYGGVERSSDAARLTALGRFLRATSIDELPTLWNVLLGDMSLVGPRPLLVHYLPRYSPRQARRHEVKPGITGLAQVSGRNSISWEQRLDLDVRYVETCGFFQDLKILIATVGQVLRRNGISQEGHATMPEFGVQGEASSSRVEASAH
jgi:lipopolysaccharide/colanic/teichoic acid biosynthesis glycosyltransferase